MPSEKINARCRHSNECISLHKEDINKKNELFALITKIKCSDLMNIHGILICTICEKEFKDGEAKYNCNTCVRSYHIECMKNMPYTKREEHEDDDTTQTY